MTDLDLSAINLEPIDVGSIELTDDLTDAQKREALGLPAAEVDAATQRLIREKQTLYRAKTVLEQLDANPLPDDASELDRREREIERRRISGHIVVAAATVEGQQLYIDRIESGEIQTDAMGQIPPPDRPIDMAGAMIPTGPEGSAQPSMVIDPRELADANTREQLDDIAAQAGVEGAKAMKTKLDVAGAIVAKSIER